MVDIADLYHTGLVVDDIDAARRSLGEAFGIEFTEPVHSKSPVRTPNGVVERESLVSFSRGSGHHIELIQQLFGGVWAPDDGGPRLHHLAFWVDDLHAESARLEALGMPVIVTAGAAGEATVSSFAYHDPGLGALFLELSPRTKRDQLYEMIGAVRSDPGSADT
jgi:catechol 2,3-dioxygenase-like lactoylglutathione lyase family enzyme